MTTQRDLKRMSRLEIIELMVKQSQEIDRLKTVIADQEALLAERTLKLEKCGTLAEAALSLNDVLDAVQKAADQYLENIKARSEEQSEISEKKLQQIEDECAEKKNNTTKRCTAMIRVTRQRCDKMLGLAEEECSRKHSEADKYYTARVTEADNYFTECIADANAQVEEKWSILSERLEDFYQAHEGLKELMDSMIFNKKGV